MEMKTKLDLYISFVFYVLFCVFGVLQAADNFGLMHAILQTFQAHACDNEELRLNCTENTVISINFISYGRREGSYDICPGGAVYPDKSCQLDNAMQVIEQKCRGQMLCRMLISPDTFHEDPCPGVRKYAEVVYKCRPERFVNKIACEDERLHLRCPPDQGILIYSATFGLSNSKVLECPQTTRITIEECQVSYAAETVARNCSGQQACTLVANEDTFGFLNCAGKKYLKVTYSCVKKELFKRLSPTSGGKPAEETIFTTSFPAWVRGLDPSPQDGHRAQGHAAKAFTPPPNTFRSEMQSDEVPIDINNGSPGDGNQKFIGFMSEWMSAQKYMAGNKEKLILYVSVSLAVGILIFVTVLAVRLIIIKTESRRSSKLNISAPITDDQFFSDSDLEQYDPPEDLPPPIINYTASLRRNNSDAQPRAPVTTGAELNHYFS